MSTLTLMGAGPEGAGASAFTGPASIAGLSAWFKADAGTSTTTDGAAVTQWNDQSTGAHNATAAAGPLYKAVVQNGLPGLLFDASGAQSMDAGGVSVSQPDTVFVVAKSAIAPNGVGHNIVDGITARQVVEIKDTTGKWAFYAGTLEVQAAATADTLAHQFSAVFNGASSQMWLDGVSQATGNPGASAMTGLRFGSFNGTSTGAWSGHIFEVIVYSGALSTTDRTNVEGYIRSKWATP